ncbi:MAG TPA: toprim domain-containing protein [Ktedonobacteraceae bacterium]|nr:toprim domain-containing protein [Ktedonobacteraceae bacterium]
MITVYTRQGKRIEIVQERELRSPVDQGERVRAYCHVHGSDHQRSLSITRATGWGHCFNAACGATVLVAEWNSLVSDRLLRAASWEQASSARSPFPSFPSRPRPTVVQPMLLPPPRLIPAWQQEEGEALLELEGPIRQALISTRRARRYLKERGIPLSVALSSGVGYLPFSLLAEPGMREHRKLLYRWGDRLLFPLTCPEGRGYIGRSLWHWQSGMTETTHKLLLEQEDSPKRWIKTNPSGWFGMDVEQLPSVVMLVEGAFDRLSLLTAGFRANEVVALVGTAAQVDWLPARVKTVVLALDGDEGGREASVRLADQLVQAGMSVHLCPSQQDQWGKDWNEHWQHEGYRGVAPVVKAFSRVRSA